jgi:predicted ATP-dependent endonuclease of OLD family
MSKSNGEVKGNENYVQHASMTDYKSIISLEVDFKPGLNIIIGKNGSGKTNFLSGLNSFLDSNYKPDSHTKLKAHVDNDQIEIELKPEKNDSLRDDILFQPKPNLSLKINGKKSNFNVFHDFLLYALYQEGYYINKKFVKYEQIYGLDTKFISIPLTLMFFNNGKLSNDWRDVTESIGSKFVDTFFMALLGQVVGLYNFNVNTILMPEKLKTGIDAFAEIFLENLNEHITKYSPIRKIRLNPDFKVISEAALKKLTIANFSIEYLVNDTWLTYTMLSDGTRRLFTIISEVLSDNITTSHAVSLNLIFLEEPELGIHPHQLHSLMQFLKEQSKQKQIIITTHSPQVLDTLEPDELDRIIICHYDSKNGTQLSHLSEQEASKAKKYMEAEAFLSDYWRFSDLEPAN